jgi:hypothetical protein
MFYLNKLFGGNSPLNLASQMHSINLLLSGISWHLFLRYEATEINDLTLEINRFLKSIYQFLAKKNA